MSRTKSDHASSLPSTDAPAAVAASKEPRLVTAIDGASERSARRLRGKAVRLLPWSPVRSNDIAALSVGGRLPPVRAVLLEPAPCATPPASRNLILSRLLPGQADLFGKAVVAQRDASAPHSAQNYRRPDFAGHDPQPVAVPACPGHFGPLEAHSL